MKIAIIGTGYIGLVTGVCLAKVGHQVTCVDVDAAKINALLAGEVPIFEPGLAELMQDVTAAKRLHFTVNTADAVRRSDAVMIAVNTPTGPDGESSDLSRVMRAAADVAQGLDTFKIIIVKSTVPVGTARKVADTISKARPGCRFEIAANPEFLREGAAILDFMSPDRICIGTETAKAREAMDEIYAPFAERGHTLFHTGIETAELIKFSANGFLATKIAFINEIAGLCEKVGANVQDVARCMGLDERIGPKYLNAGPGYGGSCFPKDTRALASFARSAGAPLSIMDAVVASNEAVKRRMVTKIEEACGGSVKEQTIAVFGVTFKPDTDDMREAPSLTIIPSLMAKGAAIRIVDPEGAAHGKALLPGAAWHADPYEAAAGADAVVILTEWRMFRTLDLAALARVMRKPRMIDLRNIVDAGELRSAGFVIISQIGMGNTG